MYLSELKLWNFRKFGSETSIFEHEKQNDSLRSPDLTVPFTKNLNVLIGENDSGKTAIIDAIKLILKTHSLEWIKVQDEDFYAGSTELRIECLFRGLHEDEAKNFTEWLDWEGEQQEATPLLKVMLYTKRVKGRILPSEVRGGADHFGSPLNAEAREYLQTTYLRPLRDAESEFTPRKNSRLSQILAGHEAFKSDSENHYLVKLFEEINNDLRMYFQGKKRNNNANSEEGTWQDFDNEEEAIENKGKQIQKTIDKHFKKISGYQAHLSTASANLKKILESLALEVSEIRSGLGTYNKLYIAAELLHLEKPDWHGLRLGLIEELEAHLHPQAQLQVIEHLQSEENDQVQLVLTTHSPNLASKVRLQSLIICAEDKEGNPTVFSMGYKKPEAEEKHLNPYTALENTDYKFLERFLDVTKANLFFAKGVILVEGWAEELLLPALARKCGIDLTKQGVSIVNVANTAFLRYARIFQRTSTPEMKLPVSVVTDIDIKPNDPSADKAAKIIELKEKYTGQSVKVFVSPEWTLEYCLFKSPSLSSSFQKIVKSIHTRTDWNSFEDELQEKLEKGSLYKVEIAHRLANELDEDRNGKLSIAESDKYLQYLIDAIGYAAGN